MNDLLNIDVVFDRITCCYIKGLRGKCPGDFSPVIRSIAVQVMTALILWVGFTNILFAPPPVLLNRLENDLIILECELVAIRDIGDYTIR